jgi:hypothetical protein
MDRDSIVGWGKKTGRAGYRRERGVILLTRLLGSGRGRARQGDAAGADVVLGLGVPPGGQRDLGLDAHAFGIRGGGGVEK